MSTFLQLPEADILLLTRQGYPVANSDFEFFEQGAPGGKDADGFSSVLRRAAAMKAIQDRVHESLPKSLAPHVAVSSLRAGDLTVTVASSVWKAKLRLSEPQIRAALAADGIAITRINTLIRAEPLPRPEPESRLKITPAAAATFAVAKELFKEDADEPHEGADPSV